MFKFERIRELMIKERTKFRNNPAGLTGTKAQGYNGYAKYRGRSSYSGCW